MSENQGVTPDQFKINYLSTRMGEMVAEHEREKAELNMNVQILVQQRNELQERLDELEAPTAPAEDEEGATPITTVKKKAGKSS